MLCAERTSGLIDAPKVQIFATDIDDTALTTGREGYYTINDAADVSVERLKRFFTKEGNEYVIKREIRDMVLFANHNFLKDPPFSKLDLIACRNVFIYLNQPAQQRVLETFHFAMNPGGYLFLGTSESIDGSSDLYASFHRENHIYQSRHIAFRGYPVPESVPNFGVVSAPRSSRPIEREDRVSDRLTSGELHHLMLEAYAPPSVVVNEEYDIVHMSERVGKFFEFKAGEPTKNLLKVIRPELRLEMRSALYQASQKRSAVDLNGVRIQMEQQTVVLNIRIRPAFTGTATKGFILIILEESVGSENSSSITEADIAVAHQLEDELLRLKAQVRTSNEQHEFQSEELKASNEELQAMNEELRSAAEELETSKEELQSINEELRTVNQELKVKIEETTVTSNNLQNLINSAEVGTIFLDRNFRVKLFTPAVKQIFNLISSDYGRPITDITNKMVYTGLLEDAELVMEKLTVVDREITTVDYHYYMMRLLPYRTKDDYIDGVVITFFDITRRRQVEEALRTSEERFKTLTDSVPQIIWANDRNGNPVYFNQRWYEYSGLTEEESIGKGWQTIIHPEDEASTLAKWKRALQAGKIFDAEFRLLDANGAYAWHIARVIPLKDEGRVTGWFGSATDVENLKKSDAAQNAAAERLQLALDAGRFGTFEHNLSTNSIRGNPLHGQQYNLTADEIFTFDDLKNAIVPEDRQQLEKAVQRAVDDNGLLKSEYRINGKEGKIKWMRSYGRVVVRDGQSFISGVTMDITDEKNAAS
jgi:PAS domain S-box-containing protein